MLYLLCFGGTSPGGVGDVVDGIARVRLVDGSIHTAEVHWYEAHGIGRKELKLKFPLLD